MHMYTETLISKPYVEFCPCKIYSTRSTSFLCPWHVYKVSFLQQSLHRDLIFTTPLYSTLFNNLYGKRTKQAQTCCVCVFADLFPTPFGEDTLRVALVPRNRSSTFHCLRCSKCIGCNCEWMNSLVYIQMKCQGNSYQNVPTFKYFIHTTFCSIQTLTVRGYLLKNLQNHHHWVSVEQVLEEESTLAIIYSSRWDQEE